MKLKIATWNVERPTIKGWKRPQRNPIINDQIRQIDADIWILTETHQVISPGQGYMSISTEKANFHNEGESRATIWSRCPIKRQLPTFDPQVAVCAEIETPAGNLVVYGSIITWAHNKGPDGQSKLWEEHYKSILAHGEDWARLSQTAPAFCAAGDFNETLNDSRWYGTATGREMLQRELERNNLECLTADYRIDHICLTKGWAQQVKVNMWPAPLLEGKPVSDHPGYYVDILKE
jgi:endonuclease/exonuclease/phosphatase family metal-dependent hydrolase